jgi:uncharacterized membrane protein YtjA (UPF0391 family)
VARQTLLKDESLTRVNLGMMRSMTMCWSIAYLVVAILAGLLGFSNLFESAVWLTRGLSVFFGALFVWSVFSGWKRIRPDDSNLNR